jgi:hypothetical protein
MSGWEGGTKKILGGAKIKANCDLQIDEHRLRHTFG